MTVEKFSISLPSELVSELDDLAAAEGLTRSALVREAVGRYVTDHQAMTYEEVRSRRIGRAIEGMKKLQRLPWPEDKTATDLIRELREERLRRYDSLGSGSGDE